MSQVTKYVQEIEAIIENRKMRARDFSRVQMNFLLLAERCLETGHRCEISSFICVCNDFKRVCLKVRESY